MAYNRLPIVELLVASKNFDPDVQVRFSSLDWNFTPYLSNIANPIDIQQDGSGWTPLMIAASLKDAEGDKIIDLLLRKEADVTMKNNSGQVRDNF